MANSKTIRMKGLIRTSFAAIAAACCWAGFAHAAQEFSCTGPESVTGKVIGPTTLAIAGFACTGAPAPYNRLPQAAGGAPFVVVNFKARDAVLKTGDMVTLKGHFSVASDPDHHIDYVIVTDAELAN